MMGLVVLLVVLLSAVCYYRAGAPTQPSPYALDSFDSAPLSARPDPR